MKWLARIVSVLFHPLILLNLGLISILLFHPYYVSKFYDAQLYTIMIFIAVNTLLMPFLSIYLLKRFKFIDNMYIRDPKQRSLPYVIIAILLGFTCYELYKNDFAGLPLVFMLATIACILVNVVVNFKFTISSHAIASGGFLGLFIALTVLEHISRFNWFLIGSILIAGTNGWARLYLNEHTEKQVYFGYLVGLAVVIPTCYFFA
jgi:hypothetical protein